jgi:hypothetical protein
MSLPHLITALILVSCLAACSSGTNKDPLLEEAAQYHSEATRIQEVLEPKIEQIDSLKRVLSKQLTPTRAARMVTLDSLKTAFEEWEKNLVEVPGMPHDHGHSKGEHAHHHHTDATLKNLPADQMRDLQREMLNNIRQMQARMDAVTQ